MSSAYRTYLPGCECYLKEYWPGCRTAPRIIFKDLEPVCAWCRTPWEKAGYMEYSEEHFKKETY
jgi:hypothetical protein